MQPSIHLKSFVAVLLCLIVSLSVVGAYVRNYVPEAGGHKHAGGHEHGSDSQQMDHDSSTKADMPNMKAMAEMNPSSDKKDDMSNMQGMQGIDHASEKSGGMADMKSIEGMKGMEDMKSSPAGSSEHNMADMKSMPGMQTPPVTDQKETKTSIEGLSQLSDTDRASAEKQFTCPVSGELIGSMGKPIKVTVKGQDVWLCCDSCKTKLMANPDEYLAKLKK